MEYHTKRLTMQNIADMAGVAKAVVSKVVNNAKVIPASRGKVELVREIIRKDDFAEPEWDERLRLFKRIRLVSGDDKI